MKLHVPFIQLPVLFDASALLEEILSIEESAWRGRTQNDDGNSALTLITTDGDPDNDELSGVMRPTPWLQRLPYTQQVLQSLGATWGRARLMRLNGQAEVKAHVDINYYWRERMRVHVPVVTTPSVRFQCGEGETHMGAGECWVFDTWRRHRVLNGGDAQRIHLVADTVGGERFWELLMRGRAPGHPQREPWNPAIVSPQAGARVRLDLEAINAPVVMSPWELREHIVFLLGECGSDPRLPAIQSALLRFSRRWQALWACHGEAREGWPRYRALLDDIRQELRALQVQQIGLRNEVGLWQGLCSHVFDMALGGAAAEAGSAQLDRHGDMAVHAGAVAVPDVPRARAAAVEFDRPIFIVSPPRSGSTLLFETLAQSPDLYTIGDESHQLIEGIAGLAPSQRGYASNRLEAADATPQVVAQLHQRFLAGLRDRGQRPPHGLSQIRLLEKTPKNALRIPFLVKAFPDARFIYLHRDPRQVLGSMIDGWQSGRFQMYPNLPDWQGPVWSFLLTPGWRQLSGRPLGEVVAGQWEAATRLLLDDLATLESDRWIGIDHDRFLSDPQGEIERLCRWAGVGWDRPLGGTLPLSKYTLSRPDPDKWRRHAAEIEPRMRTLQVTRERAATASSHG